MNKNDTPEQEQEPKSNSNIFIPGPPTPPRVSHTLSVKPPDKKNIIDNESNSNIPTLPDTQELKFETINESQKNNLTNQTQKLKILFDLLNNIDIDNKPLINDIDDLFKSFDTNNINDELYNEYLKTLNNVKEILQKLLNKNINNKFLLQEINKYIEDKIPDFFIENVKKSHNSNNNMHELRDNIQKILLIYLLTVRNSKYLKLKNNMKNNNKYYENFNKNRYAKGNPEGFNKNSNSASINKQIIKFIMIPISSEFLNILKKKLGDKDYKNVLENLYTKSPSEYFISIKNLCKNLIDCTFKVIKKDADETDLNVIKYSYDILQLILTNILDLQKIITSLNYNNENKSKIYTILKIRSESKATNVLKLRTNSEASTVYINYDNNNYLFGPFDKIVYENNEEIVQNTNYFFEKLNNSESVCIIGYGASGAGKTSTLIARKNQDYIVNDSLRRGEIVDKGIIYYILQKFLNNQNLILELSVTELYYNYTKQICELEDNCEIIKFEPSTSTKEWVRMNSKNNENILEYILNILDNKRKVKSTSNNPVSSRSHVIIKIKFNYQSKSTKNNSLIICDFAGVENKFNCNSFNLSDNIINIYTKKLQSIKTESEKKITLNYIKEPIELKDFNKTLKTLIDNDLKTINSLLPNLNILLCEDIDNFINNIKKYVFDNLEINTEMETNINKQKKIMLSKMSYNKNPSLKNLGNLNIDKYIDLYLQKNNINSLVDKNLKKGKFNDKLKNKYNSFIKNYISYNIVNNFFKNNKIDLILNKLNQKYCNILVEEGQYINNTLKDFRTAINKFVNNNNDIPQFTDQCLPIQCNPYYKDCFGMYEQTNSETQKEPKKSILYDNIIKDVDNLNFCILNVVNLNESAHNDTNKYIDISDLIYEYQRILNFKYRMKYLPMVYENDSETKINTFLKFNQIINDYYSKHSLIDIEILKNLKDNYLKYLNVDDSENVKTYIDDLLNFLKTQTQSDEEFIVNSKIQDTMKNIIDIISNYNSITLIGTLEFLDLMSKYGLNYTICNFKTKNTNNISNKELIEFTQSMDTKITKYINEKYEFTNRTKS